MNYNILAQAQQTGGGGAIGAVGLILYFAIIILVIAGMWKTFTKAGKPGWASIIPIYNIIVVLQIAGKPLWWILLMFIPLVNFIIMILVWIDFAKAFGKGAGYGVGLTFLPIVFLPMLGFGDAQYQGAPAV